MSQYPSASTPPSSSALAPTNRDVPLRLAVDAHVPCDGCGYDLRTQPMDGRCPECNAPVSHSLVPAGAAGPSSRADRRWAASVALGLAILLVLFPQLLWIELFMDFSGRAFGNAANLNVIGPKVWAVPLVQRSIGRGVEHLGALGSWLPLMNLLGVWLITAGRGAGNTSGSALRLATRWLPALLVGGFLGFMLNAEGIYYTDVAIAKYALVGVGGVELPGTLLLLAYLAHIAGSLGKPGLRRRFAVAAIVAATAQAAGVGMALMPRELAASRELLVVQAIGATFQAACVVVGLLIAGTMVELVFTLVERAAPRRWRRWLD